jgi:myo-inositol-1(or 4)-monophosphatase
LVATGFPYEIRRHLDQVLAWARTLLPLVRDIRRAGAAAVDLAWVASGRLDAFYEVALKPWDAAAGWLLVEEAGGRVSSLDGRPFDPFVPELLASNGKLHQRLLELLA